MDPLQLAKGYYLNTNGHCVNIFQSLCIVLNLSSLKKMCTKMNPYFDCSQKSFKEVSYFAVQHHFLLYH